MSGITKSLPPQPHSAIEDNDFTLNAAQMQFMINAHNAAETAYAARDWTFMDDIMATGEWQQLFGAMSWDQAYDRYELMMGFCEDC